MKMFKVITYSSVLSLSISFSLIQSIPKVTEMEIHSLKCVFMILINLTSKRVDKFRKTVLSSFLYC